MMEQQEIGWDRYAVVLMALAVVACGLVWAFFAEPWIDIDDIVMLNPVYVYLHSGVMAFPSYGFFHEMVVHPPTHYLLLAWLMKAGVPLAYVAAVPPLLLILLTVVLICWSRFPSRIKLGLLFGLLGGSLIPWYMHTGVAFGFSLRPDLHLAFAWFAGLVALETGRLDNWNLRRLFVGSALLTYSSALHYPAFVAWTGVLVYVLWVIRAKGRREAVKPGLAMIAGGCLVGIPYLFFFVIPHWKALSSFVHSTEPMGGISASVGTHIRHYKLAYLSLRTQRLTALLFWPLAAGIPTVLISTLVLLFDPRTRGLGLASLPHLLVLLLLVQHKLGVLYLFPELILYVCAVALLVVWLFAAGAERFWSPLGRVVCPAFAVACIATLALGTPWLSATQFPSGSRVSELNIARASGRKVLGPNALVGSRIGRFYTNGGDHSYLLEQDLVWTKLGGSDLRLYFENFDAVAEDGHMSDVTDNDARESLSSWYAHGVLDVRGFYFSALHSHLSYLLLNPHRPTIREGYGTNPDGRIFHFQEQPTGDHLFLSLVCNTWDLPISTALFRNSYPLPTRDARSQEWLDTFILRRTDYPSFRAQIQSQCSIRDEFLLGMALENSAELLATLKNDQVIHFYERLEDALEARYGPEVQVDVAPDGSPSSLKFVRGEHKGEAYTFSGRGVRRLFPSGIDSTSELEVHWHRARGGLEHLSDGLMSPGRSVRYSSKSNFDYLATRLLDASPGEGKLVVFSMWAKALNGQLPEVSLHSDSVSELARTRPIIRRPDGWVLLAGWSRNPNEGKFRVFIKQKRRTASLIDNLYVLEVREQIEPAGSLPHPR